MNEGKTRMGAAGAGARCRYINHFDSEFSDISLAAHFAISGCAFIFC